MLCSVYCMRAAAVDYFIQTSCLCYHSWILVPFICYTELASTLCSVYCMRAGAVDNLFKCRAGPGTQCVVACIVHSTAYVLDRVTALGYFLNKPSVCRIVRPII